jgi:hypothetical protein
VIQIAPNNTFVVLIRSDSSVVLRKAIACPNPHRVPNLSSSYSNNQEKFVLHLIGVVLFKNQNDHDQFDFPKFLLFMNKMFILYFALLHEQNVYFIFCSSSKWKRNNKKNRIFCSNT